MRKLAKKINAMLTVSFLCLRAAFVRQKSVDTNNILIAQGGNIGDALLNATAIVELVKYYISNDKKVFLTCSLPVWSVLRLIPGMQLLTYVGGPEKNEITLKTARRVISLITRRRFEKTIAFMCKNYTWQFLTINFCSDVVIVNMPYTGSVYRRAMNRILSLHAAVLPDDPNESRQNHAEKLFRYLGIEGYQSAIAYIPKQQCDIRRTNKYITVTVDSSDPNRRWPAERFIELVSRLLSLFEYDVLLMGSSLSENDCSRYLSAFENCAHVTNMVGKTDVLEWIELIRGSEFHVGVDSGAVHIAASVGTPSFCLTGRWDGCRFFPYEVRKKDAKTCEPICIVRKDAAGLGCFDCGSHGKRGTGNPACRELCKRSLPCLCLEKITVDDVMEAIEAAQRDGVIY